MGSRSNLGLQLTHCSEEGVEQKHFLGAAKLQKVLISINGHVKSKWPEEEGRPLKPALKHISFHVYILLFEKQSVSQKKNERKFVVL